jgi:hypothetical protein
MSFFIVVFLPLAYFIRTAVIRTSSDRSYPADPFFRRFLADSLFYTRVSTVGTHVMPFSQIAKV